jgi:PAS domain S-box-containing protein
MKRTTGSKIQKAYDLLDKTNIPCLVLDDKLQLEHISPAYNAHFSAENLVVGQIISAANGQLPSADLAAEAAEVLHSGKPQQRDIHYRQDRWYSMEIRSFQSATSGSQGLFISFTDISVYKNEQTIISKTSKDREYALELAQAGTFDIDLSPGAAHIISPIAKNLFGFQPEEHLMMVDFLSRVHPEDQERVGKKIEESQRLGQGHYVEYRVVHPDGKQLWLASRAELVRDPQNGEHTRLVGALMDISDRKYAEQESRHNLERYQKLFSALDDGFCLCEIITDQQGTAIDYRFLECNKSFEEHTGLKDATGKRVLELLPDLEKTWIETYGRVVLTGETIRFEQGSEEMGRWFDVYAFPFPEAGEGVFAIQFKDITARKQVELELSRSESLFRSFAHTAPAMLWVTDPSGYCTFMSNAWYEFSGQPVEEGLGFGWLDVVHPDDREKSEAIFREANQKKEPFYLDYRIRDKEGAYRWAIDVAKPRFDEDGQFLGYVGSVIDIHDRKIIEEALKESEAIALSRFDELEALYSTAPVGLCVIDQDLRFVRINQRLAEINGHSVEEHLGKTLREVLPQLADQVEPLLRSVLEKGEPMLNIEISGETAARPGVLRHWVENWFPIKNAKGQVTSINMVAEEVTQRKAAEQALKQAKEEAEKAARAKEDFLSTMSHEIRTPLNGIVGLTNLLLNNQPRPDQLKNLNTLLFSSRSLQKLVNDILDYSRIASGRVEVEQLDYHLETLLSSIQQAQLPLADEKNNVLEIQLDDQIPPVLRGDSFKLSQVLNNLISNAIKFTDGGRVVLKVAHLKSSDAVVELGFSIIDDGIGISLDKLEHIFEKFTQADNSTIRRYGGTGLGLSITRSLLEMMGSGIEVDSREGEGSVFRFVLRQEVGKDEVLKENEKKLEQSRSLYQPQKKLKILLAEDAAINRMVVQQYLDDWWAVQADEAVNGLEAVKKSQETTYDLVLMDIRMPEMDGVEASRQIRRLGAHYRKVPIIALTADIRSFDVRNNDEQLFDVVVYKPFEPDQLKNTILSLTHQSSDESTVANTSEPEPEKAAAKPKLEPDFAKAEEPFDGLEGRKLKFYQMSLQSLEQFRTDFRAGFEKPDIARLKEIMHKEKLLLHMLGLEAFYQQMYDARQLLEEGKGSTAWEPLLNEITEGLKTITEKIRLRMDELS